MNLDCLVIRLVLIGIFRPRDHEHLMIIFFDILLLDDNVCLRKPHSERRLILKDVVQELNGRANLAEQEVVDFSRTDGRQRLERAFLRGVTRRWEGHVLKGCDDPYFSMFSTDGESSAPWIKLKKDYIPGLGDTVDFALIGAKYDARDATSIKGVSKLLWTHFYIGCLMNVASVNQLNATPVFRVVDVIGYNSMNVQTMQYLNRMGEFCACSPDSNNVFVINYGQANISHMDVIFKIPFVAEMLGSGFEKPSGCQHYTLRFPRILKLHTDRGFEDAISFPDLQALSEKAQSVPAEEQSQEEKQWIKRLKLSSGAARGVKRTPSISSTSSASSQSARESSAESIRTGDTTMSLPDTSTDKERDQASGVSPNADSNGTNNICNACTSPLPVESVNETMLGHGEPGTMNNCLSVDAHRSTMSLPLEQSRPCEGVQAVICVDPMNNAAFQTSPNNINKLPISTPQESSAVLMLMKQHNRLKSPISSIPVYFAGSSSSKDHCRRHIAPLLPQDAESTFSHADFLNKLCSQECRNRLASSNPYIFSHGSMLGLVLLDIQDLSSLSIFVYGLSKALANMVKRDTSSIPVKGTLFFLNPDILRLGNSPEDHRFCLQLTWENIGKSYFYSSVRWELDLDSVDIDTRNNSPGEKQQMFGSCSSNLRLAVSFNPDEVKSLGEFSSIDPLVHVNHDSL